MKHLLESLCVAALLAGVLALSGCAEPQPYPQRPLTPEQRQLLLQYWMQQNQQPLWGQPGGRFYQPPLKLDPPFQYGPMLPPLGGFQPPLEIVPPILPYSPPMRCRDGIYRQRC